MLDRYAVDKFRAQNIAAIFFSRILCVVLLLILLSPSRIAAGLLQIHVLLRIVLISQEEDSCH